MLDANLPTTDYRHWHRLWTRCRVLGLRLRLASLPCGLSKAGTNRTRIATAIVMHGTDYIAAHHIDSTRPLYVELEHAAVMLDRDVSAWLADRGIGGAA